MQVNFSALRNKEIVDMRTGLKIGYADDMEIDTDNSSVISLIVYGRQRAFGLMGRDDDMVIKCSNIRLVGEDTILVDFDDSSVYTKTKSVNVENLLNKSSEKDL